MNVVQTGKSASIRIEADPINYKNSFNDEIAGVDKALEAIYGLHLLSKRIASIGGSPFLA